VLSVAVLISGAGSNLRALLDAAAEPDFPARVVVVGADREAEGFAHAEEYGIPTFLVPWREFDTREEWGAELAAQLAVWRPDLVVLSGLMRLLPSAVVEAWSPNLINTHPAYLPEFPGAHAVRDALAAGVVQTGASVIVVDDGVDTGPIVAQERRAAAAHRRRPPHRDGRARSHGGRGRSIRSLLTSRSHGTANSPRTT
jgi:phosphoribosylglycinamide formyltransferase-1